LEDTCDLVVGDFHKIPFEDETFDAVYALEATTHSPHREKVFAEAFRVLKKGGKFLSTEWCVTDKYDEKNKEHEKIRKDIEYSNGLSVTISTKESLQKFKDVGFDVTFDKDYSIPDKKNPIPYYYEFTQMFSLSGFATSWIGLWFLFFFTWFLELFCLAPKGTSSSQSILQVAANSLKLGGQKGIYTVLYMIIGEKK